MSLIDKAIEKLILEPKRCLGFVYRCLNPPAKKVANRRIHIKAHYGSCLQTVFCFPGYIRSSMYRCANSPVSVVGPLMYPPSLDTFSKELKVWA